MAEQRDRPHGNSNFVVEFGSGASRSGRTGFAEVVFAPFTIAERPPGGAPTAAPRRRQPASGAAAARPAPRRHRCARPLRVVGPGTPRQGAAAAGDEREAARRGPRHRRLDLALRNVRPVSLSYSPLRGVDGGILMETIELAFDDVEMA